MACFHWIVLLLVRKLDGQRSPGGIYHLITGKRSAQTIQDAHLFRCAEAVSVFKEMQKQTFDAEIRKMTEYGWLAASGRNGVLLTPDGEAELSKLEQKYRLPEAYDGAKYEWTGEADLFWERLALTVQSITFILHEKKSFIPVTYRLQTQRWVKKLFRQCRISAEKLSENLHHELHGLLNTVPDREAKLFVSRLTTPDRAGKTFGQLADEYFGDPVYTKIVFQSVIHRVLVQIAAAEERYRLLAGFVERKSSRQLLTETAKETDKLLKQGKAIEEISRIRKLRISTIEDHLIELAIYDPHFSYADFITEKEIAEVLSVAASLETKRLRLIKEALTPDFSYFKLRLALTSAKERV
ncbi:Uncharacterized protein YpbB [Evansella caseinilytica]|uniref:Uncharacterized protein YpbB n=1 Tax=Evansella caseinilytica TaxID=1503961 RepID=A0A1H3V290_9BACI|nr:helix-turn-helix domain-containing protein [Evansella caseinilytica]SDZ68804.1 Uncharacterized protein YpbB [Evansella caseinilytica]